MHFERSATSGMMEGVEVIVCRDLVSKFLFLSLITWRRVWNENQSRVQINRAYPPDISMTSTSALGSNFVRRAALRSLISTIIRKLYCNYGTSFPHNTLYI